jgi:hypothetical protein
MNVQCPSCGGSGGGPFGPPGSAWDTEDYVCPRCLGVGAISLEEGRGARPGISKAVPAEQARKRNATGG